MKSQVLLLQKSLSLMLLICVVGLSGIKSQHQPDSAHRPKIMVTSSNSFKPFNINTKENNIFIVYELPNNTSKVILKFIDSKGEQLGDSHTEEGSGMQEAVWNVNFEDVGFALSPQLSVEVYYQSDSLAIYNINYVVYPDTVKFHATNGWGAFISNNYTYSDTSWHPVSETHNTFTINNLPPRTDTIKFEILRADSTAFDSLWVYAPQGEYLDSAVFENVRMDQLPLDARLLRALIWCEGGPDDGLDVHQLINITAQKPKLVCISDNGTLHDSVDVFVQNQVAGQALLIDSAKYARITNGPGHWNEALHTLKTVYQGPYSFDMLFGSYTIEAWVRFDTSKLHAVEGVMTLFSVDTIWRLWVHTFYDQPQFVLSSLGVDENHDEIFSANVPYSRFSDSEWHHVALTVNYTGTSFPSYEFYFDAERQDDTHFDEDNFNYIWDYTNYSELWGTQAFNIGHCHTWPNTFSAITAVDEVRLWYQGGLSGEQIKRDYRKKILQQDGLVGYWTFDDLRNHLGQVVDISYSNNVGKLVNGATFIPQHPPIQMMVDTIHLTSSNTDTDSVTFQFLDEHDQMIYSEAVASRGSNYTMPFDMSLLPYEIAKLRSQEYYTGAPDTGFRTDYRMTGFPPIPIATPRYNWNRFYHTDDTTGKFYNSITVSGLPLNTTEVELGYKKGNDFMDVETYTENSIPYRYSLNLNGTDNYIETANKVLTPDKCTIELWFKTTTTKGGKLIGFTDNQNGVPTHNYDREIVMEKDGSLRFIIRSLGYTYIVSAAHAYNDGEWHHVVASYNNTSYLYVDGSLVDVNYNAINSLYFGYWVIGRNHEPESLDPESLSEFFEGSICEIKITDLETSLPEVLRNMYSDTQPDSALMYFKMDEGSGTSIHDQTGNNNGTLKGSNPSWNSANVLSYVIWHGDMINKDQGTYYFYAKVHYPGGPEDGAYYELGKNVVEDPFPYNYFGYHLENGFGYFNEGTALTNHLHFKIDYSGSDSANWKHDFVKYKFFTPDHLLINHDTYTYNGGAAQHTFDIDMGDAPVGSYLSIESGYTGHDDYDYVMNVVPLTLYFHSIIPPVLKGDFGPFDQAIAPGSMVQENTFVIKTEILTDLNKVIGKFYDKDGNKLGEANAVELPSDTIWHLTYDMGSLSPPVSTLRVEYYLGDNPNPVLVQGPFPITIHRTRPTWFDFIEDNQFYNVDQNGDEVTFEVDTPFEKSFVINNSETMSIPSWLPLLGGSECKMESPTAKAKLKYTVSEYKLDLNGAPEFFQKVFNLGAGPSSTLNAGFNYSQHNTYGIDENNNLIATQNFAMGGEVTTGFKKLANIAKKVKKIIEAAKAADPATIIVSPSFSFSVEGQFEYSARQHLRIDTTTGKWGSYGNLKVDANPDHEEAYKNSTSYKFYSGSMGLEFSIGAQLLDGVAEGDFGLDGRFVLGFGHSYKTIPDNEHRKLRSFAFQTYGRFYISVLWGWYTHNLWGPKLFYSKKLWGDNMKNAFPPLGKKDYASETILAKSSWPELGNTIHPIRKFSKMPLPFPQPRIVASEDLRLFSWVERGSTYGERKLMARYLSATTGKFAKSNIVEINQNALNGPVADALSENIAFFTWAQTRHDPLSFRDMKPDDPLREFVESQDIWYAIYDLEKDSLLQKTMLDDDLTGRNSGRTESNPVIVATSDDHAIIAWQVVDLDTHISEIWYTELMNEGGLWLETDPAKMTVGEGIVTKLRLASPKDGLAVAVWMNTSKEESTLNKIMTATFENEWSDPQLLVDQPDHYYNYLDMSFYGDMGGLVMTTFVEDSNFNHHEKLSLYRWDNVNDRWDMNSPYVLFTDSANHLQHPTMTVNPDGKTCIAYKAEQFVVKSDSQRVSQIDLLVGDVNNPELNWAHVIADPFICDTNMQVKDIQLTYASGDSIIILTNEYPMFMATNAHFEPVNGIIYGDPYMNLVLRCFAVDENGNVTDVDEEEYFLGINEKQENKPGAVLYQNYPNPCTYYTNIRFKNPAAQHMKLELFDMNGTKMATLADQRFTPGLYEISLNTALLKPGTYIYRLSSSNSVSSLQLIVAN